MHVSLSGPCLFLSCKGTELLLGELPKLDTTKLNQDDANALELGPRAVDNAFTGGVKALGYKANPQAVPCL